MDEQLIEAIKRNDLEKVKAILAAVDGRRAGIDRSWRGVALIHASTHGRDEVVRLLAAAGAGSIYDDDVAFGVVRANYYGNAAFGNACANGHLEAARLLLATGVRFYLADHQVEYVCRRNHREVALLLERESIRRGGRLPAVATEYCRAQRWPSESLRVGSWRLAGITRATWVMVIVQLQMRR